MKLSLQEMISRLITYPWEKIVLTPDWQMTHLTENILTTISYEKDILFFEAKQYAIRESEFLKLFIENYKYSIGLQWATLCQKIISSFKISNTKIDLSIMLIEFLPQDKNALGQLSNNINLLLKHYADNEEIFPYFLNLMQAINHQLKIPTIKQELHDIFYNLNSIKYRKKNHASYHEQEDALSNDTQALSREKNAIFAIEEKNRLEKLKNQIKTKSSYYEIYQKSTAKLFTESKKIPLSETEKNPYTTLLRITEKSGQTLENFYTHHEMHLTEDKKQEIVELIYQLNGLRLETLTHTPSLKHEEHKKVSEILLEFSAHPHKNECLKMVIKSLKIYLQLQYAHHLFETSIVNDIHMLARLCNTPALEDNTFQNYILLYIQVYSLMSNLAHLFEKIDKINNIATLYWNSFSKNHHLLKIFSNKKSFIKLQEFLMSLKKVQIPKFDLLTYFKLRKTHTTPSNPGRIDLNIDESCIVQKHTYG